MPFGLHLVLLGLLVGTLGYIVARSSRTMVYVCLVVNHLLAMGFVLGRYLYLTTSGGGGERTFLVGHLSCLMLLGLGWLIFALYDTQTVPGWKTIGILHVPVLAAIAVITATAAPATNIMADAFSGVYFLSGGAPFQYSLAVTSLYAMAAAGVLAGKVRRRRLASRFQAGFLLAGVLIPLISAGFETLLFGAGVRLPAGTPALPVIGVTLGALCFVIGVLRYHVVDIVRQGVYENLREVVLVLDLEGRVVDANLAARRLFGGQWPLHDMAQIRSRVEDRLESPDLFDDLARHMEQGTMAPFEGELRLTEDTRTRYLTVYALPVEAQAGMVGWAVTMGDVTGLRRDLDRARFQAMTDDLTGLYNRRFVSHELLREVELCARTEANLAVLLIDVDHFKEVNDAYGHQIGDRVLAAVAHVIKENLRPTDTVGRFGGEEFIVMCPGSDLAGGMRLAERLRRAVADCRIPVDNVIVRVTISVGVTAWQGGAETVSEVVIDKMLREADEALYRAKNKGRNRVAGVPKGIGEVS
ncbi:MAG: diguanylate cyclase [Thermoanaerobacterales bacterium]|nr:diguanylate cyclase [Thermoanaerobacterales bacterium]